jgi:hypothetical protein
MLFSFFFIQTYASLLAKEMSYKMFYKVFLAKWMFEKYISNPISTLVNANKPLG